MYHTRSPDFVVGGVAVGLQQPMKVLQKVFRSGTISAQTKVEHRFSSRSPVLPQIRLMILPPTIMHLHLDQPGPQMGEGFVEKMFGSARVRRAHCCGSPEGVGKSERSCRFPLLSIVGAVDAPICR